MEERDLQRMSKEHLISLILGYEKSRESYERFMGALELIKEIAVIEEANSAEDIADELIAIYDVKDIFVLDMESLALAVQEIYEQYVEGA
jgi:hypothetical protein